MSTSWSTQNSLSTSPWQSLQAQGKKRCTGPVNRLHSVLETKTGTEHCFYPFPDHRHLIWLTNLCRVINIIYTNYSVLLAVTRSTNVLVWLAVSFIIYTNYSVLLAVTRSTNVLVWLAVSFIIYTNYSVLLPVKRSTNVLVSLAVSFRTQGSLKLWKKFIRSEWIYGHLITSSSLVHCWLTNEWHLGLASSLLYWNFLFKMVFLKSEISYPL